MRKTTLQSLGASCAAFLGTSLLVGLSLGSTHVHLGAAERSVSPVADTAIGAARGSARTVGGDHVAPSSHTRIDVVPHAAERGLARSTAVTVLCAGVAAAVALAAVAVVGDVVLPTHGAAGLAERLALLAVTPLLLLAARVVTVGELRALARLRRAATASGHPG